MANSSRLFGFGVIRQNDIQKARLKTFAPELQDDGAVMIPAGGLHGTFVDLDGSIKTEADLVTRYREMTLQAEIATAVEEICNEAIVRSDQAPIIKIMAEDKKIPPQLMQVIEEEFQNILGMLEFQTKGYYLFRHFYVDGRLYFHIVIDDQNITEGIQELRFLDARKIRKFKEYAPKRVGQDNSQPVTIKDVVAEYFVYSEKEQTMRTPISNPTGNQVLGVRIAPDSIIHLTSQFVDPQGKLVWSYLHQAIKPLNQLKSLEDASIIYTLARAPQRRIFYIDVGNLPKAKAEQHVRQMMTNFKNKLVYDSTTGEIRDDRKFMTMLEDFWLPRREGGKGTEIDTIGGDSTIFTGSQDILNYFLQRLYKSLNVPISRLNPEDMYVTGRSTQISRDEIRFSKFIDRLRLAFNELFLQALEKQLILKMIISPEDWDQIRQYLWFKYAEDNQYAQLKDIEILNELLNVMERIQFIAGKYRSHNWVMKNILKMSDEEIAEEAQQIQMEWNDPRFAPTVPPLSEEPPG